MIHEDTSVRVLSDTMVVANDPMVTEGYCEQCYQWVTPVVSVTILNDEEWIYNGEDTPLCPECLGPAPAR